jgi:hypothetical protein
MHFERYCWQDHVIPRGWWMVDLNITLLILAILTVSCIGDGSADGASRDPMGTASIAPAMQRVDQTSLTAGYCDPASRWADKRST